MNRCTVCGVTWDGDTCPRCQHKTTQEHLQDALARNKRLEGVIARLLRERETRDHDEAIAGINFWRE